MPYYPENADSKAFFDNPTEKLKIVSDYTGLNFSCVESLEIFDFWGFLHDSVVWVCSRSEKGREYLRNAYCYSQTKPDRSALRANFGGENGGKQ